MIISRLPTPTSGRIAKYAIRPSAASPPSSQTPRDKGGDAAKPSQSTPEMPIHDPGCLSQKSILRCLSPYAWIVTSTQGMKTGIGLVYHPSVGWLSDSGQRLASKNRLQARYHVSPEAILAQYHRAFAALPPWSRCDWGIGRGCR